MLTFSEDGETADRQMRAVIFYLTTFGYIDGDFDDSEKAFVRDYIRKLVTHRVNSAIDASEAGLRQDLTERYTAHFHEVFQEIDRQVNDLFTEVVSEGESQDAFVASKLKLRCFEIFKSFDEANQNQLMDTIDELIHADGQVHPAEVKFRAELAELLEDELGVELLEDDEAARARVAVGAQVSRSMPAEVDHPFFGQFEFHYSKDPDRLREQIAADLALLDAVSAKLAELRSGNDGKLQGKQKVQELAGQAPFLDGHVHVMPRQPGAGHELTVLGDLHGCYSCLKAALRQSEFLEKVEAHRKDPTGVPRPGLVLLGDYIDRGMFSYHGVLRTVFNLLLQAPEYVYVLRGNHEFYFEHKGDVYGGVKPAEAINTLKPHLPSDVFQRYMRVFDELPNMLLFDQFLFVHGGIARDSTLKDKYRDLSSLNDWDIRFQMMWSDPSSADVIPMALQDKSARFPFGRLQSLAFLQRIGCHTLVRGHEKVEEGFRRVYKDDNQLLITLFSAGGKDNADLPEESSYRGVTPMAMTLTVDAQGEANVEPWRIQYDWYQNATRNAFHKSKPEIEHRAE